ncbi:MAG TPA: response regulator [Noviherbaspirillum sp.]|jgi:CheY-like chemotaxis protein|uniref:response regulator n=1 Tax=Noviherbaspirillum sp. TaxID=1926288 RepID=UPI002DDD939A|nr:response regulator [Noviherbaspirillum sp.]HEV2608770.1 response regulator [Noviherbaspirillum sp.]
MNDHFVQRHDEQGALVKAAPDSNRTAFAIDTVRRNGPICMPAHADAHHLHLPVRILRPDAGSVPQPTPHPEAGPFTRGFTASGAWSQSGAGDVGGNSLASANGTLPTPEDENASTGENSLPSALPGGQRRILIVDDNVDAAESLGELLKVCGHDIHIAHDGASAISEALRFRPEAVILDIGLPAMNGYEVAQRLRLDVGLNTSLLVALTGYAEESDRISAEKAGFDHYFAKPLDINKLVTVLDNLK